MGNIVDSVPVQQIVTVTSKWIHVLGSDQSHYLLPAVLHSYSPEHAYVDSVFLKSLGISTVHAAVLVLSKDLASEAGLAAGENSNISAISSVGWRLPRESSTCRLMQILPSRWLSRISNRDQFFEVEILDTWFQRRGRREVIFRQTGAEIEVLFIPSGTLVDSPKPAGQPGYHQQDVYKGLDWARIQTVLTAKLKSLRLSNLEQALNEFPIIGEASDILRAVWSETVVNRLSFDQTLADVRERLFAGTVNTDGQRSNQVRSNRVRGLRHAGAGHPMGIGRG